MVSVNNTTIPTIPEKFAEKKRAAALSKAIRKQPSAKKLPGQKSFKWWSPDEHQRFLVGMNMFGQKDVKKISMIVGSRSPTQVRSHMQKYLLKRDQWDIKHEKKLERIGNVLLEEGAKVLPLASSSDSECESDVTCPPSPSRSCADSASSYESSLGSVSGEGAEELMLETWDSMELAPMKTDFDELFDRDLDTLMALNDTEWDLDASWTEPVSALIH